MLQKGKKYVSINTVNKDILFLLLCSITAEQSLCWHPHRLKQALCECLLVEGDMRTNQSIFVCFLCSSRTFFGLLEWLCWFSHQCVLMMNCSFDVFAQKLSHFLVCNHQIRQWLLLNQEANYQETINISHSTFQPLAKGYDKTRHIQLWHRNCQLNMFLWCMDWENQYSIHQFCLICFTHHSVA